MNASVIRSIQVDAPGGRLRLTEADLPEPGPSAVRVRVEAVGVCHSDAGFVGGYLPGLTYPLTPGHEIAGVVDAVGPGAEEWSIGERVAVGWFGGYCGTCRFCRRGEFVYCENTQVPGLSYPGGYADALIVPTTGLARIPEGMAATQAAPMACAGVTVFNALRHSRARAGDLVAVIGIGGLGHLGVQFARKMGFETVAVGRGESKGKLAETLGAHHYIDSSVQNVASELQALGGAKVVLATAPSSAAIAAGIDGLGNGGELLVVGVDAEPLPVTPIQLIAPGRSVRGCPAGSPADIEETMSYASLTGVRAAIEELPLARAQEAFERMMANEARFRVVLTTGE